MHTLGQTGSFKQITIKCKQKKEKVKNIQNVSTGQQEMQKQNKKKLQKWEEPKSGKVQVTHFH